jgi:hypothetical protein
MIDILKFPMLGTIIRHDHDRLFYNLGLPIHSLTRGDPMGLQPIRDLPLKSFTTKLTLDVRPFDLPKTFNHTTGVRPIGKGIEKAIPW